MGSVKDLIVEKSASGSRMGTGCFVFSDRYSIFDWGEMPNHIPRKGESLCLMGAYFFEKLSELGFKTHYRGLIEDGEVKPLATLKKPSAKMAVHLVRVVKPEWDGTRYNYSVFKNEHANFLVPLEVIFRNALPEGSSVFRRLSEGSITPEDLGLDAPPVPGQNLSTPMLDVSSKLESTDRYMSWNEAQEISGLSDEELGELKRLALEVDRLITGETARLGLTHEDGKIEFGMDHERRLMLVDVLGTPDECRFVMEGMAVSKEVARIHYRKTPWYQEMEAAKKKDAKRWKDLVKNPPPPLAPRLEALIAAFYQSCCNGITQRTWFDAPPLKEIVSELKKTL